MTKQRKRKTNGQSGAGGTELNHRSIGPRKAGITILGERVAHLKEHGTIKDIKEDIEVKTLAYEENGKESTDRLRKSLNPGSNILETKNP